MSSLLLVLAVVFSLPPLPCRVDNTEQCANTKHKNPPTYDSVSSLLVSGSDFTESHRRREAFCFGLNILWCPALSFTAPPFLIQHLVFCTPRFISGVIQKCHSASRLLLKHYHTNKGGRTTGSNYMRSINLNNSSRDLHTS